MNNRFDLHELIRDLYHAYEIAIQYGGNHNVDFAGYAARHGLDHFRSALSLPDLTQTELSSTLRLAIQSQKQAGGRRLSDRLSYLAHYVSNLNSAPVTVTGAV